MKTVDKLKNPRKPNKFFRRFEVSWQMAYNTAPPLNLLPVPGQVNNYPDPAFLPAFKINVSPMQHDDFLDNGQSQTEAAMLYRPGLFDAVELIKHL